MKPLDQLNDVLEQEQAEMQETPTADPNDKVGRMILQMLECKKTIDSMTGEEFGNLACEIQVILDDKMYHTHSEQAWLTAIIGWAESLALLDNLNHIKGEDSE